MSFSEIRTRIPIYLTIAGDQKLNNPECVAKVYHIERFWQANNRIWHYYLKWDGKSYNLNERMYLNSKELIKDVIPIFDPSYGVLNHLIFI